MPANEGPALVLLCGKRQIPVVPLHLVTPRSKKAPAPGLREDFEDGVE